MVSLTRKEKEDLLAIKSYGMKNRVSLEKAMELSAESAPLPDYLKRVCTIRLGKRTYLVVFSIDEVPRTISEGDVDLAIKSQPDLARHASLVCDKKPQLDEANLLLKLLGFESTLESLDNYDGDKLHIFNERRLDTAFGPLINAHVLSVVEFSNDLQN